MYIFECKMPLRTHSLSGRPHIECPEIEPPEIFFESIFVLYSFTVQLPKNYNRCLQYKYNNTSILQYKCFGWVFQKTLRGIRSVDTVGYTNILSLRALYCTVSFGSELYVLFFSSLSGGGRFSRPPEREEFCPVWPNAGQKRLQKALAVCFFLLSVHCRTALSKGDESTQRVHSTGTFIL